MNKHQPEPYFILTTIDDLCYLCAFCRFAEWAGECEEGYYECQHPLWKISEELSEDVMVENVDCWAFRPQISIDTAQRMVVNFLQGKDVIIPEELILGRKKGGNP